MVIGYTKSGWRPLTRHVPQRSILGPVLFIIFINNRDGAECTPSKFVDDTKLDRVPDTAEGCAAIQRELERLEKWIEFQQGEVQSPTAREE